jgi:hypothetical protein
MQEFAIETEHVGKQTAAERETLRTIVWKTGWTSVGDVLITRRISEVAASRPNDSASFCSNSAWDSRLPPTRVLAFVPPERSLRPCVWLFAPLRDKFTSAARRSR